MNFRSLGLKKRFVQMEIMIKDRGDRKRTKNLRSFCFYGTNLFKSLGNVVANRTFGMPVSCISNRSNPIAKPPSGGIP